MVCRKPQPAAKPLTSQPPDYESSPISRQSPFRRPRLRRSRLSENAPRGTHFIYMCARPEPDAIAFNLNRFDAADKTIIALILHKRAPNFREIHSRSYADRIRAMFTQKPHVEPPRNPRRAP